MSKPPKETKREKSLKNKAAKNGKPLTDAIDITVNGVRVDVNPEVRAAVLRAYEASKRPLPKEMTTNQAAEYLDVSRPFVIKLIRRGELPCRMVGKHRRIPTPALVEYRNQMFEKAKGALDEMTHMLEDAGIYHEMQDPPSKVRRQK